MFIGVSCVSIHKGECIQKIIILSLLFFLKMIKSLNRCHRIFCRRCLSLSIITLYSFIEINKLTNVWLNHWTIRWVLIKKIIGCGSSRSKDLLNVSLPQGHTQLKTQARIISPTNCKVETLDRNRVLDLLTSDQPAMAAAARHVASYMGRFARCGYAGDTTCTAAAWTRPQLPHAPSGPLVILRRGIAMIPGDHSPGPADLSPDCFDPEAPGNLIDLALNCNFFSPIKDIVIMMIILLQFFCTPSIPKKLNQYWIWCFLCPYSLY